MNKEKIKDILSFIKNNIPVIVAYVIAAFLTLYEFPYYIDATGGAIDVSERVKVENKYDSEGSFNMAYVRELPGTAVMLFIAKLNPKWDIVKLEDVLLENETEEDDRNRNKLLLSESTNNAIRIAYGLAGKKVEIESSDLIITLVTPEAKTDVEIGDILLSIDGNKLNSYEEFKSIITSHKAGDTLNFVVRRDDKELKKTAIIYEEEGEVYVGMGVALSTKLKTDPELTLEFKDSESGPSGGLMTALAIYDSLIEYDLTRGLKIVGTGTIEADGTVGPIGGVKYKLNGAVRKKADLFFVPAGENYKEALKYKKEYDYDIKIVAVEKISDAVKYLMTLD